MGQEKILLRDTENHICEIPMKLPSLNKYINVCRRNRYESATFKKELEESIMLYLMPLKRFKKAVRIDFIWYEKDMRRDADNITFAKKFILDAMVKSGKLQDDSRKYVRGFTDTVKKGNEYKVQIIVHEVE